MTNRDMVKGKAGADPVQAPNAAPLPAMPAPEDSDTPSTREEPIDSPQSNPSATRDAPGPDKQGLATER